MTQTRDHGGGLDAAIAEWGGRRDTWMDLSTGINPMPYPIPDFLPDAWTALPDRRAFAALYDAARQFWNIPDDLDILAGSGASAIIARLPLLRPAQQVSIPTPTYNEHAASFRAQGWQVTDHAQPHAQAQVVVHPNNPDGRLWRAEDLTAPFRVIDESFGDIAPDQTLLPLAQDGRTVILKSFGKFWGLAGLRLGFAIGTPDVIAPLREAIGPWQISGPALETGAKALRDPEWAQTTRRRLAQDSRGLDQAMAQHGTCVGGTDLFRLYDVGDAVQFQNKLAEHHIWSRIFPYSTSWVRLGLPHPDQTESLHHALSSL